MNNTDNKEKNPRTYTPRAPFVAESDLMTEEEAQKLIKSFLQEADFEEWAINGLMFLFWTVGEMANQDQIGLQDLANNVNDLLYENSAHCHQTSRRYLDGIAKRWRETDWHYTKREERHAAIKADAKENFIEPQTAPTLKLKSELSEKLDEHNFRLQMRRLSCALESENFDAGKCDAIQEIISELMNESQISLDHPQIIPIAFPLMLEAVGDEYGKGVFSAIRTIIQSEENGNEAFTAELDSFHLPYFDTAEYMATSAHEASVPQVSKILSGLLNNPNLPANLKDAITTELQNLFNDLDGATKDAIEYTPDYISRLFQANSEKSEVTE